MLEVNGSPVNTNQGGRQEPSATVERLKATLIKSPTGTLNALTST